MDVRALLRRWGDPALGVLIGAGFAIEAARYPGAPLPVTPLVGAAVGLSLAARQRFPLIVFTVMVVGTQSVVELAPRFQGNSAFLGVAFVLSLYSVGRHTRGAGALLGGVAMLVGALMLTLDDGDRSFSGIAFFVTFSVLPWGAGLAVRLRVERVRDLQARNLALEEEARRAVAEERARIARELHDVVSHAIAVTVLQARGSRRLVGRDDEAVRQALAAIEGTSTAALADMRRLLSLLRSTEDAAPELEPQPTLDRLDELLDHVRAAGLPVELVIDGERLPMTPGIDLSAFRIVQEALTNVLKHGGPGARAAVRLRYGAEELGLEVDSTGPAPARDTGPGGHGLTGIRERVAVVGGVVEAGPTPDGWRVSAAMPYLPHAEPAR